MKEHKKNQLIFHKTNIPDDDIHDLNYIVEELNEQELVSKINSYFTELNNDLLSFPAKSYAVALIYSFLLEKYFDVSFLEALSDPDLLHGNDKFFKPFNEDTRSLYENVITYLKENNLTDFEQSKSKSVLKTVDYFKKEFLIKT